MLSIISTILKTKLPKEIQIKLYKDLSIKSKIILIIKGKLGQYKIQTEYIPLNSELYFKNNFMKKKFLSSDSSFSMKSYFIFEKIDDKGKIKFQISDSDSDIDSASASDSNSDSDSDSDSDSASNIDINFSFPFKNSNYYEYLRDVTDLPLIENPYYSFSDPIDIHYLSYIKKIFEGLVRGYTVNLELKGIGYQANLKEEKEKKEKKKNGNEKNSRITKIERNIKIQNEIIKTKLSSFSSSIENFLSLIIDVGFSHNIKYSLKNKDIEIKIIQREYIIIKISGIDKDYVNQIAAEIYKIRKPEPYKGKGIRYQGKFYIEKGTQRTTKRKT